MVKAVVSRKCEKCAREAHQLEKCGQCARMVCHACEKSSKISRKFSKGIRHVICKTCWSTPKKRTAYKAA